MSDTPQDGKEQTDQNSKTSSLDHPRPLTLTLVGHDQHILRIDQQTLRIRHPDRLRIRRRRRHPRHAPGIDIGVELRRDLEELDHDLWRIAVAVDEAQPAVGSLLDVIRVREQGGPVRRLGPRGVGFGEGVGLAGRGGVAVGEPAVVGRSEGAVAHAELVVGVVPRRSRRGGEVDLVPRAPDAVGPGGQGAVEGGVEGDGGGLARFHRDAGAESAGGGPGEGSARHFRHVAYVFGGGVGEGGGAGGGRCQNGGQSGEGAE